MLYRSPPQGLLLDKSEVGTKGVSRTSSLSSELLGVSFEPRKSISSNCSACSPAASVPSSFDSQEVGMRPASVPLFSAWSKPGMGGMQQTQVNSNLMGQPCF